ncbi:MAG: lysophospholipid acyltransferase family protein [Aquisalimonadaceae bacterium]
MSIIRALLRASSWLPLPVAHALGATMGQIMAWLPGKARLVTRTNLALCFPELDRHARRRLAGASFRELGKQILEMGIIWHADDARLQRLVVNPEAMDTLESHWQAGRGLLVACPHLGNWELTNLYLTRRHQVHTLYRPPRQPYLEPLLVEARERTGARSLPATPSGIRTLYKALRGGALVGILPDQEPRESGVFAPFFGVPAKTMTLLCQMAGKTDAPVVFVSMLRLPWGRGFRLEVLPAPEGVGNKDHVAAATALNAGVEHCVRLAPAQYQWTYKRFRRRPDGGRSPYKPGRTPL